MEENIINKVVVNADETVGTEMLLLGVKPYTNYIDGVKGNQEGISCTALSEKLSFTKVNIKIPGMLQLPFTFEEETPILVSFEGLTAKLWQNWNSNGGAVQLSLKATNIKPITDKRIKLNGDK